MFRYFKKYFCIFLSFCISPPIYTNLRKSLRLARLSLNENDIDRELREGCAPKQNTSLVLLLQEKRRWVSYNFLFLFFMQSTYSMQNQDKSTIFKNATIDFLKGNNQEENLQTIKKCIENGIDPDPKMKLYKENALRHAAWYSNKTLFNYLIQHHADVNSVDINGHNIFFHFLSGLKKNPEIFDAEIFESLLKYTSPISVMPGQNSDTSLSWMCRIDNSDLLKLFIKHGLDVRKQDATGLSPLTYAIAFKRPTAIKEFCHAGALIINYPDDKHNNNFHISAMQKLPKESLKAFITHIRADFYHINQEEKERKVLAVFSVLSTLPIDLRFFILDKLTLVDYEYCFNKRLCKKLSDKKYINHIIPQVNKRIDYINQLLQVKNDDGKTALNLLHETQDNQYIQEVESLLNETQLAKDFDSFKTEYANTRKIPENNLAGEMAYNCIRLLKD